MKLKSLIFSLVFFTASQLFAQSSEITALTGTIKEVKSHFAGQHTLVVDETELVLLTDPKDKTGKSFEINKPYKDILLDEKGTYILNPKYEGKVFKFTYTVNGKGWKCIKSINAIKK